MNQSSSCFSLGLERLNQFDSNYKLEEWCFNKIIYRDDVPDYKFYNDFIIHKKYKVPLDKIIGSWHTDYANKNWIEILGRLKRFRDYYTKDTFVNYINSKDGNIDLSFSKFGEYFIITGGNHRTCQAKFSGLEYIETDVVEHILNEDVMYVYRFFERLNILDDSYNSTQNARKKEEAEILWVLALNNKKIYLRGMKQAHAFIEFYNNTQVTPINLLKIKALSRFKQESNYNYISIKKKCDLVQLKNDIVIHKSRVTEKR